MNRKELKKNARSTLKKNYIKTVIVIFVVTLVINLGYSFTTKKYNAEYKSTNETMLVGDKYNFETFEKILDQTTKFSETKKMMKTARGVVAPIVNRITQSKDAIISLLSAFNLFYFKHNTTAALFSLAAALILIINYFFIQNIISIGRSRYLLEVRRYNNTKMERVLFPYKKKYIPHLAYIMFTKNFFLFLWSITIVGGIIKYFEYSMIPYILAENPNISRKEAFRLSKILTNNHKLDLFKLDLSFIGWILLDIITFNIASIFITSPYYECVFSEYYMALRKEKKNEVKDYLNDEKLDIPKPIDDYYPEENKSKERKNNFDKRYGLTTYILFFFTFSFVGWVWEVLLHLITEGVFVNRGTMFGPWLPIYGFGGVLILLLLKPFRKRTIIYFIMTILLCGVLEYFTALFLDVYKGLKWWDYTGYFLNLHGRICFEGLLVFGLGGCAVTYVVAPALDDLYSRIKPKIKIVICIILVLLFGSDIIYSRVHPNTGKGITTSVEK